MQTDTSGYVADTSALDRYVNQIVNPALENFDRVSSRLYVDGSSSFAQMLGTLDCRVALILPTHVAAC